MQGFFSYLGDVVMGFNWCLQATLQHTAAHPTCKGKNKIKNGTCAPALYLQLSIIQLLPLYYLLTNLTVSTYHKTTYSTLHLHHLSFHHSSILPTSTRHLTLCLLTYFLPYLPCRPCTQLWYNYLTIHTYSIHTPLNPVAQHAHFPLLIKRLFHINIFIPIIWQLPALRQAPIRRQYVTISLGKQSKTQKS